MVRELLKFKGYTVDEMLRQFRKVDMDKPSIDFVALDLKNLEKSDSNDN